MDRSAAQRSAAQRGATQSCPAHRHTAGVYRSAARHDREPWTWPVTTLPHGSLYRAKLCYAILCHAAMLCEMKRSGKV